MDSKKPPATISGKRHSASGEASRRAELERIRQATPLERMEMALALGRRRLALLALRGKDKPDER